MFDSTNPYLVKHFFIRLGTYEAEGLFDDVSFVEAVLDPALLNRPVLEESDAVTEDLTGGVA